MAWQWLRPWVAWGARKPVTVLVTHTVEGARCGGVKGVDSGIRENTDAEIHPCLQELCNLTSLSPVFLISMLG